jgi:hypothetical protein
LTKEKQRRRRKIMGTKLLWPGASEEDGNNDYTCIVCGKPLNDNNWSEIKRLHGDIIDKADMCGESSLTNIQKTIYHNTVHAACIVNLHSQDTVEENYEDNNDEGCPKLAL